MMATVRLLIVMSIVFSLLSCSKNNKTIIGDDLFIVEYNMNPNSVWDSVSVSIDSSFVHSFNEYLKIIDSSKLEIYLDGVHIWTWRANGNKVDGFN